MHRLPIGEPGQHMQATPREPTAQDRIITLLLTIDSDRTISFVKQVTLLEAENTHLRETLADARTIIRSLVDREHNYDV